eukprot:bmy_03852T0
MEILPAGTSELKIFLDQRGEQCDIAILATFRPTYSSMLAALVQSMKDKERKTGSKGPELKVTDIIYLKVYSRGKERTRGQNSFCYTIKSEGGARCTSVYQKKCGNICQTLITKACEMGEGSLFIKLAASWPVTNQDIKVHAREAENGSPFYFSCWIKVASWHYPVLFLCEDPSEDPTLEFLRKFGVGLLSGTIASVINIPFDVAKSRIQGPQPVPGEIKYRTCFKTMATVYQEEGILALYKGLLPKIMRLGPGGAVMLLVYEYTYSWLQENW